MAYANAGKAVSKKAGVLRENLMLRIDRARKRKNLTVEQLADKSGLSFSCVSKLLRDKRWPSAESLVALAQAVGSTPDKLLRA